MFRPVVVSQSTGGLPVWTTVVWNGEAPEGADTAFDATGAGDLIARTEPRRGGEKLCIAGCGVAARRAHMLIDAVAVTRETTGPIELPTARVEIDFDIESAADGRIYLWGFAVWGRDGSVAYREFSCFDDLDQRGETALARRALRWLRSMVEPGDATVYHYSGYEVARIRELAIARTTLFSTGPAATPMRRSSTCSRPSGRITSAPAG